MATNNTESVNFKVGALGGSSNDDRQPCNLNRITLEKVFRWLDKRDLDAPTTARLKKMCSSYPEEALQNWLNNFTIHLSRARDYVTKNQPTNQKSEELTEKPEGTPEIDTAPHVEEFE